MIKFIVIFILFLSYFLIIIYYERYDLIIGRIKIGYYSHSIRYGGVERVIALLINLISKEKYFNIYLITDNKKSDGEYKIPNFINRICLSDNKKNIFDVINEEKLDIIIYNFYNLSVIKQLNSLNKTKSIFYNHSSFLYWVFKKQLNFNETIYPAYKSSKYVISLIPFENDYLFKKWGINSILMDNPISFEYDSVKPSSLSNKNIIMIGRIDDPVKRYDLGIKAMSSIIKKITDCKMIIIADKSKNFINLIKDLKLENNIEFTGFQKNIEIFLKNASLHILTSISECYPMALVEAKLFGIPTIICGLDFLSLAKGGTIIIYDDNPDTIAKESIKILKNEKFRKELGKEARESIKNHKNKLIAKKWIKLLLSVYKGDYKSYTNLNTHKKVTRKEAKQILDHQLSLLKRRYPCFNLLTLEKFESYSFK